MFFANDVLAAGAGWTRCGRCVAWRARDMLVAGFDDIPMAAWPRYQPTTIRQPVERIVEEAVAWAMPGPHAGTGAQDLRLSGELVVRSSTLRDAGTAT
ncbi:hypothetical protein [Falsiroseomonas sp. HW251]|uniref:hypothetical protein n=1 Tax=Falsiroseomonas sp. HW251 TaxID=3390998 RepID=UPI003D3122E5